MLVMISLPTKTIPPRLTFIIILHMERLNLIVVCCGKNFVSTNEWACNATIAHTREIVLYNVMKKIAPDIGNII